MDYVEFIPFWAAIVALIALTIWASSVIVSKERYIEYLETGLRLVTEIHGETVAAKNDRIKELEDELDNLVDDIDRAMRGKGE